MDGVVLLQGPVVLRAVVGDEGRATLKLAKVFVGAVRERVEVMGDGGEAGDGKGIKVGCCCCNQHIFDLVQAIVAVTAGVISQEASRGGKGSAKLGDVVKKVSVGEELVGGTVGVLVEQCADCLRVGFESEW